MRLNLIFWTQALDNSSNDRLVEFSNETPSAKKIVDIKIRNDLSGKFFAIKQNGETFFEANGFELTKNENSVLIKLKSAETDIQGRAVPVLCLCENAFLDIDEFCRLFETAMKGGLHIFPDRIQPSFEDGILKEICDEIKKKNKKISKAQPIAIITFLCLVGLTWLIYKFSK